jgi:hypothetical protein
VSHPYFGHDHGEDYLWTLSTEGSEAMTCRGPSIRNIAIGANRPKRDGPGTSPKRSSGGVYQKPRRPPTRGFSLELAQTTQGSQFFFAQPPQGFRDARAR